MGLATDVTPIMHRMVARLLALDALLLAAAGCAALEGPGAGPPPPNEALRSAGPAVLYAGAASRRITPRLDDPARPVFVAGLERGLKATGVHDDLFARALVISEQDGAAVGLVLLDLIGFFHDDVQAAREELRGRHPEVRLDHLAVASTHTHAGPDVIGLWTPMGGSVDDGYVAQVRTELVDAVAEAWRRREPASLYTATATAPGLARDTRLPDLIDDTVMALGLRSLDGKVGIASLVNWNSHPSVSGGDNSRLSADFPRAVIARMEREWGGVALYASGDLGGQIGSGRVKVIDPATGKAPADRMKRAELLGDRIAAIALEALARALPAPARGAPEGSVTLRVRARDLFVPMDNPRFAEGLSIGLIRPRRLYPPGGGEGRLPSEIPRSEGIRAGAYSLKTEVAVVDLGPAVWALIPGELYPELALGGIQKPQDAGADFQGASEEPALRRLSDRPLFLIGLANDELGYIIPKSQWDNEPPYAYGRDEAQYGEKNSVGPETAPLILAALRELLMR